MNYLIYFDKKQIKKHLLFWAIIIVFLNLYSSVPGSLAAKIIGNALEDLNYMFVFYIMSFFVLPRYWPLKRWYMLIIAIFTSYWVYSFITYFNYFLLIPFLGGKVFYLKYPVSVLLIDNILYFSIFGSAGTAAFFYQYSAHKLHGQSEKEKKLLETELNFLKNQFNSHVTFNFLNYCYSKIHRQLPNTADSIECFSDMLHYTLLSKPDKEVPLSNEITNIENFITLQKLLNPNLCVIFNCYGVFENKYILSHILISFVENACNCANYNSQFPLEMSLRIMNSNAVFAIRYNVEEGKKMEDFQLGTENTIKVLNIYYTNNYNYNIEEKDGFCNVRLSIKIGK